MAGPSTLPDGSRALQAFSRVFRRDGVVSDKEGLHSDGDQTHGVLHHPVNDVSIDLHIFSLSGLISTWRALPPHLVESDGGEAGHLDMVLLLVGILPFPVADHEVAVVTANGHR